MSTCQRLGEFVWNEELNTVVTQADADVVCHKMDMARTLDIIPSSVPILLLHGTDDELIPVAGTCRLLQHEEASLRFLTIHSSHHEHILCLSFIPITHALLMYIIF